ncbi:hypothetical protein ACQPWW_26540 [Micromonospora sp. CA-240977]|uniref:hypothetical protein n=1 Tax=Micromonospora sp. CA-240977 TaxID=3239957 RepID=UPI003D8E60C2
MSTVFTDFADYWTPFLGGQGAAPAYVTMFSEPAREGLREVLAVRLPVEADGSIRLVAQARAVRAVAPE